MVRETQKRRAIQTKFETREEGNEYIIAGYFAVFNSNYEMFDGASESIDRHAFDGTLGDDIRALINHDTTLVLARTAANTLELNADEHGLYGRIRINRDDTDALNLYARVKRGDVSQCSIGFEIVREQTEVRQDGGVHWTILEAKLFEVSCCTFPAYEATSISARKRDYEEIQKRRVDAWREKLKERMRNYGA